MNFIWAKKGDIKVNEAFSVRFEVFVTEQGFSPDSDIDKIDDTAFHLIGYDENGAAQCAARLFCEHGEMWHAGRIAVKKSQRGKGVGKLLMAELANKVKEQGAKAIVLGAQYDKAEFYEKCGYKNTGKEFLDEGYPHVEMVFTF